MLTLLEDKKGKIWIGHREAGISVWDKAKGQFERVPFEPDPEIDWKKASVRSLYEDSRGWLWVGTLGRGVFIFDENRHKIGHLCRVCKTKTLTLGNDFVFDFQEDHLGRIWIATDGKGVSVFDPATRTSTLIHSNDQLDMNSYEKSLCLDRQGNLWIGTAGSGLYKYDLVKKLFEHFYFDKNSPHQTLSHNIVTDLALDSLGTLWIATDGDGLNIFNPVKNRFQYIKASASYPQALNTNALYHLMFDNIGNLWVGTFNEGVDIHKTVRSPFMIHENQNDYGREGLKSVLALQEGETGNIWIGTDGGGLFYATSRQSVIKPYPAFTAGKRFPKHVITCLQTAGNDGLWVGTFADGLCYFNTRTGAIRNYRHQPENPTSLAHNNVWSLECDKSGGLWIGTLGGGLNYLPPGSDIFKRFQPEFENPNSLSSVQIVDVLLDINGQYLWAASEDKGLNRLHIPSGQIKRYNLENPEATERLSCNNLQCLFQDKKGRIWIGTEFKGLDCLVPETEIILHYDTSDGLPSNMVNSIAEDEHGDLWISTQKGIVRFDPMSKTFRDIGTDDNLKNNQYNPRAALRLTNGRLVFGGTNGFSIISPSDIHPNLHTPRTIFTDLLLSGQVVPIGPWNGRTVLNGNLNEPGTIINLSYADRGVVFEFTGTDYTKPAKNKFAYQLEGFDKDWLYTGPGQHRAIYSFLKGGAYLLKVKASNSDGVWGEPSTLIIKVTPPFWKTWWFYLLCLATVLGITFLIIRYFWEHQKAIFQEKTFKAEQKILRLQNESLEREVEAKQARLSASVLQSAHKNKFLADLKTQVQKIESPSKETSQRELRRVIRAIDSEINQEDYWEQFQITFNQMHQDFVHELQQRYPAISTNDIRLSCFIRMGFSNAEIASILNVTINGVEQSKYRLKKKMGLDKDASLNEFIWQL